MIHQQMNPRLPVLLFTLLFCLATTLAFARNVEMMSKEKLREKLGQEGVVIVDARTGRDWKTSEYKIKGAVRPPNNKIVEWASSYGKDTFLVLYCA